MGDFYRDIAEYSSHALSLSKLMFAHNPQSMRLIFDKMLRLDEKTTKLHMAKLLHYLLPEGANDALPLIDVLLHSLELEDDRYDDSADHEVCEVLAHLLAFSPEYVKNRMEIFQKIASDEIKVLVINIFSLVVRHASIKDYDRWSSPIFPQELYRAQVPEIIDRMFLAAGDIRIKIDERSEIADKLEDVVDAFPEYAVNKFDRLLGRLSMAIREADQEQPPESNQDLMQYLEYQGRQNRFESFIRAITKTICNLIQHDPEATFPIITNLLGQISSEVVV